MSRNSLTIWKQVYELSGCGFESRCCHLNFRYGACFKQGVLATLLNHLTSLAKWSSVHSRTKCLWVRILLLSEICVRNIFWNLPSEYLTCYNDLALAYWLNDWMIKYNMTLGKPSCRTFLWQHQQKWRGTFSVGGTVCAHEKKLF